MFLLDKLKVYKNICLYMSSGNDFYIIEELANNNNKTDLIIMSEIYPENYNNLNDLFLDNLTSLSDFVVHNYKINILSISNYSIDLDIDNKLSSKISKYNNKVKLLELEYVRKDIKIKQDIMFVVSENLTFSIKYLIKNNINIDTIYIHGYRGSNVTLDSIVYIFDRLNTKLYITNDIYLGYKDDVNAFKIFSELKTYNKSSLKELYKSDYNMTYFKVLPYKEFKYKIISLSDFSCIIDDKLFKIELGMYESKFSSNTYINGIMYKRNSDDNVIGLDIILHTGIIINNEYVEFRSINHHGIKYDTINAYDKKYILINNKFVRMKEEIPLDLSDIDIKETFDIKRIVGININKGELII